MKYFAIIENGMVTGVVEGDAPENQEFIELDQESIEPKSNCMIVLEGKKVIWKPYEALVREKRNQLLQESDWVAIRAAETGNFPKAWKDYRQALRDLPGKTGFPDIDFPKPPQA